MRRTRARLVAVLAAVLSVVLVATGSLLATPSSAAAVRYEAESATISQGVVESNHAGFSGTGFVNYDNVVGSVVQGSVDASSAGPTSTLRTSMSPRPVRTTRPRTPRSSTARWTPTTPGSPGPGSSTTPTRSAATSNGRSARRRPAP